VLRGLKLRTAPAGLEFHGALENGDILAGEPAPQTSYGSPKADGVSAASVQQRVQQQRSFAAQVRRRAAARARGAGGPLQRAPGSPSPPAA
jgi:hypothetical protein